eukprot:TRINITY_DN54748_c0_g1_i1.p1 TRINITY_DN54748_c0_g1~~TRINITY_DN54748_c0_g1_i1.p1  ORF type:complete len:420 (-),score=64.06 TRINITY_DN54748_c0_g1_i1:60-1223(-)
MGGASSARTPRGSPVVSDLADLSALPEDMRGLPAFFAEILVELLRYKSEFGGSRNFTDFPRITCKVRAEEFRSQYSDFEYIFLTVLGLAMLHTHGEEIADLNNGKIYTQNPGVQLLERVCGMTMHGNRDGANNLIRTAPNALLEAFSLATRHRGGAREFFKLAFDRTADPCLEGRMGRLLEYLEKKRALADPSHGTQAPWEDVSLQPLPVTASARDVVGEHLRVFVGECTWRWSRQRRITYEEAKRLRLGETSVAEDFNKLYNAQTFAVAMRARGVLDVAESATSRSCRWETRTDTDWAPLDENVVLQIERARDRGEVLVEVRMGPKSWRYQFDLKRMKQVNPVTGKEREIRCVDAPPPTSSKRRKLTAAEFQEAVRYFVDLHTLPP